LKQVAQSGTVSVLDTFDKDISVVEHEIISAHTSRGSGVKEIVDSVVRFSKVTGDSLSGDEGS
jgi:hypothetical protein